MKRIKLIISTCCVIAALSISCADNVLNLDDPGSPNSATFFETEAQLEVGLAGVYESLIYTPGNFVPTFPQILDHSTDLAFNRGNVAGAAEATQGGLSSTSPLPNNFWNRFYTGIQRANNLLGNMEKAKDVTNPARYDEIRAEALFLRAIFYSYLTELFGDIPFRKEAASTLNDLAIPKTSKAEIVTSILADLEEAANILPQTASARGRASANAANGLIARIALHNGNYELAASKAQEVMDSGLALYPDYESLFTQPVIEDTNNQENILDISFTEGTRTHGLSIAQGSRYGGWSQFVPVQQTLDSYETINGLPIDEDPSFDPVNPFDNRDPRMKASIAVPGELWTNRIFQQHSDSIATWQIVNGVQTRVMNLNSANPGGLKITDPVSGVEYTTGGSNRFTSFTGYVWKKFSDEPALTGDKGVWAGNADHPVYIMRLAEMYLTYAEAKIESGNIDATVLDAINAVRERGYNGSGITYPAVVTMDQAELRRIVRRERKVELANEGLRLFDIRRWGIAEKLMNGSAIGGPANGFSKIGGDLGLVPNIDEDGHVTYPGAPIEPRKEKGDLNYRDLETRVFNPAKDYLWPIPQAEIDASEGLVEQNPNY
ncbi:RagB/SusD family nutrient uptake outer membrane protein [Flavivirga algicola]|uniref:RagB/SusD family nutrient uptake outer membrane protein n=1 Tax=Flavivirga algicola TaxID=2729136 RepID=A0ABX1RWG9_9FLAO|nr:RagB/SusD family nutrient uptake outer membrane protein [Flavivirga algicola]NMH86829.1 RagB/SusD family nutrient uptake outer membrane protein [Flavivirga algicola]